MIGRPVCQRLARLSDTFVAASHVLLFLVTILVDLEGLVLM